MLGMKGLNMGIILVTDSWWNIVVPFKRGSIRLPCSAHVVRLLEGILQVARSMPSSDWQLYKTDSGLFFSPDDVSLQETEVSQISQCFKTVKGMFLQFAFCI